MVEFEYLDETLDINATQTYHLSIQVSPDGLTYSILDLQRNKYVALKNYTQANKKEPKSDLQWIKPVFEKDEFLGKDYKSVALIWVSMHSTLVPDPLFKKEYLDDYFKFNQSLTEDQEVLFNKIKRTEAWDLFPIPKELNTFFKDRFPAIQIFHQAVPFINNILHTQKNGSSADQVFIYLYSNLFDIVVTHDKNLKLYNCFPYKHVNDLLYFVLYVFDQLKLSPEKTSLSLAGKVTRQSSFVENLKRYIKKPVFQTLDTHYTYSYTFGKLPEHSFANLLSLYPCVL